MLNLVKCLLLYFRYLFFLHDSYQILVLISKLIYYWLIRVIVQHESISSCILFKILIDRFYQVVFLQNSSIGASIWKWQLFNLKPVQLISMTLRYCTTAAQLYCYIYTCIALETLKKTNQEKLFMCEYYFPQQFSCTRLSFRISSLSYCLRTKELRWSAV